jgi:hypothetical protein
MVYLFVPLSFLSICLIYPIPILFLSFLLHLSFNSSSFFPFFILSGLISTFSHILRYALSLCSSQLSFYVLNLADPYTLPFLLVSSSCKRKENNPHCKDTKTLSPYIPVHGQLISPRLSTVSSTDKVHLKYFPGKNICPKS